MRSFAPSADWLLQAIRVGRPRRLGQVPKAMLLRAMPTAPAAETRENFLQTSLALQSVARQVLALPLQQKTDPHMATFDYIIVGAGSAGCILARRLSDQADVSVLLIEAGGPYRNPFAAMPRGFHRLYRHMKYFWTYPANIEENGTGETWRYGKGLGGSSAVNGMWYMRGMPRDFDQWAAVGGPDWSWHSIERAYQHIESYQEPGAHASRGRDGPLQITQSTYRSPVTEAALLAGQEQGLPFLTDINQPNTDGIGYSQFTINRTGHRGSSYTVFLEPVKSRRNLTILQNTETRRIVIEDGRATGVICEGDSGERLYHAAREVIVCAGAIQSPKLLQLSGIGPADVLRKAHLPVVHPLEAVGENLFDHPTIKIAYELENDKALYQEIKSYRKYLAVLQYFAGLKGFLATSSVPLTALVATDGKRDWPGIQLGIIPLLIEEGRSVGKKPVARPAVMFMGFDLRPKCRGRVRITSSDHRVKPSISIDWQEHDEDRKLYQEINATIRKLARSPALSSFCGTEILPMQIGQRSSGGDAPEVLAKGCSHNGGTCRMGHSGADSVVDAQLRVHGVAGLRVADASIMPAPVSGNTNAIAMVIGWKAVDFILADAARTTASLNAAE